MIINQISVFLENRRGQLLEITNVLAKNNIDLRAINVAESQEYGVIRFIVDDYEKALDVLTKNEYVCQTTKVVVCAINDQVGGLSSLLSLFNNEKINIEYMYSIFSQIENSALMIFKVENPELLENILLKNNYNSLSKEELKIK